MKPYWIDFELFDTMRGSARVESYTTVANNDLEAINQLLDYYKDYLINQTVSKIVEVKVLPKSLIQE